MSAKYQTAADLFDGWRDAVLTGQGPVLFRCGEGRLGEIPIGPGLVTLFGGPPGAGKTAFSMQLVVDGLRINPELRALVANVEVGPGVLLDRQLARLSGIDLSRVRARRFGDDCAERLDAGLHAIDAIAERLAFLRPPYDLGNVAAAADAHGAGLIVLDYIQRIRPPGDHGDKRGGVNLLMDYLRQFADADVAVIVVAAVGRQRDDKGRTGYSADALNLASFRESSELEFGADDAFILAATDEPGELILKHLKSRHGEPRDMRLAFDGARQVFTPMADAAAARPAKKPPAKLQAALRRLWDSTVAGDDDSDHSDHDEDDR